MSILGILSTFPVGLTYSLYLIYACYMVFIDPPSIANVNFVEVSAQSINRTLQRFRYFITQLQIRSCLSPTLATYGLPSLSFIRNHCSVQSVTCALRPCYSIFTQQKHIVPHVSHHTVCSFRENSPNISVLSTNMQDSMNLLQ